MNKLCLNTGSPPGSWPGGERTSKGAVQGMAVQAVPRQSGLCEDAANDMTLAATGLRRGTFHRRKVPKSRRGHRRGRALSGPNAPVSPDHFQSTSGGGGVQ